MLIQDDEDPELHRTVLSDGLLAITETVNRLDLHLSQKVDRLEFTQIIQNKANSADLSNLIRILNEIFKSTLDGFSGFEENSMLAHLLGEETSILDKSGFSNEPSENRKGCFLLKKLFNKDFCPDDEQTNFDQVQIVHPESTLKKAFASPRQISGQHLQHEFNKIMSSRSH